MRAALYYNNQDIRIVERPVPAIGPGEILVRILASGVCGSDVMEWYRIKKAPLVLGHEIAGTVEAVGDGVTRYRPGDRVVVSHHVPCNTCRYCLAGQHTVCETLQTTNFDPGGFCQFVRVPALQTDRGVLVLPDGVSFEEGTFVEPLGCVVRGQRLIGVEPGKTVAVLGSGISGILHIALAKALGVGTILATDVCDERLRLAGEFGASGLIRADGDVPALVRAANHGRGADVVIVCAGALSALEQGLASVDRGGTVLFFATPAPGQDLPIPVNAFWRNSIKLQPSYAAAPYDLAVALDLIRSRAVPVAAMVTHRLPLEQTRRGFDLVLQGKDSLKVIIEPFAQG